MKKLLFTFIIILHTPMHGMWSWITETASILLTPVIEVQAAEQTKSLSKEEHNELLQSLGREIEILTGKLPLMNLQNSSWIAEAQKVPTISSLVHQCIRFINTQRNNPATPYLIKKQTTLPATIQNELTYHAQAQDLLDLIIARGVPLVWPPNDNHRTYTYRPHKTDPRRELALACYDALYSALCCGARPLPGTTQPLPVIINALNNREFVCHRADEVIKLLLPPKAETIEVNRADAHEALEANTTEINTAVGYSALHANTRPAPTRFYDDHTTDLSWALYDEPYAHDQNPDKPYRIS